MEKLVRVRFGSDSVKREFDKKVHTQKVIMSVCRTVRERLMSTDGTNGLVSETE